MGLNRGKELNPYNAQLQDEIKFLATALENKGGYLQIVWIKSHMKIRGNEMADMLATQATQIPFRNDIKIPRTDLLKKMAQPN